MKPDIASVFISTSTLMVDKALLDLAMPAMSSASNSQNYLKQMKAGGLTGIGIAKPNKCSAFNSIRVLMNAKAMCGFSPKYPQGLL